MQTLRRAPESADLSRLESIIASLYSVRGDRPGTFVHLDEADVVFVVSHARQSLLEAPSLLRIAPPLHICGDLHGQFWDLLRLFEFLGRPPAQRFLFLGDYVDRGPQSLEVIVLLLALRLCFPDSVALLRGNHESALLNKSYGFYRELEGRGYSTSLQRRFADCFNCLPLAAVVGGRIFCCHGGLSPDLRSLDQINDLPRPADVPKSGLLCDLLWADPEYVNGWEANTARGCSYLFGPEVVSHFLETHDLDLVCRAHQVVEDGYEFFSKRGLVTIFSAPDYSSTCCNAGVAMTVGPDLKCCFTVFRSDQSSKSSGKSREQDPRGLGLGPGVTMTGAETETAAAAATGTEGSESIMVSSWCVGSLASELLDQLPV